MRYQSIKDEIMYNKEWDKMAELKKSEKKKQYKKRQAKKR